MLFNVYLCVHMHVVIFGVGGLSSALVVIEEGTSRTIEVEIISHYILDLK
jgi:hypothetical protein